MTILYADKYISCEQDAITIYWYYFPLGTEKKIFYREIKQIEQIELTLWQGKLRIWGMDLAPYWFHLDLLRPTKNKFIAIDCNEWIKSAITPEDCDRVWQILLEKISD